MTRVRAKDGKSSKTFAVGANPWGVVFDGVYIWVTNFGDHTLTKLQASNGAFGGTFSVGTYPQALAFDGANIWVTDCLVNTVSKRSPGKEGLVVQGKGEDDKAGASSRSIIKEVTMVRRKFAVSMFLLVALGASLGAGPVRESSGTAQRPAVGDLALVPGGEMAVPGGDRSSGDGLRRRQYLGGTLDTAIT